ncbi:MAG TPA: SGNH/GDSL hydrolase family protein [Pirellulales bacterium]|jgi:lysophospholipase L1-like esterase|nr:SGNH/GDSL hydrolase family protein [Pirellulales bacterium]
MSRRLAPVLILLASLFAGASTLFAADPLLKTGDYVAVVGDSITEQKLYSMYIEDYLLMCQPAEHLKTTQFGWGGETAGGFERRMENDMLRFKPTVVTTNFGMNDGGYSPMNPDKARGYRENQTKIVEKCKSAGVRVIVVGSPGVVDSDTFRNDPKMATMYNKTLHDEREIAKEVATAHNVYFADVYGAMMDAMTKAKAKYGNHYAFAGGDGVHPGPNGHIVMAYAYLKALGCSGDIGKITVDLASDKAEATDGHKVESCKGGVVELESTRYPFCFYGDPAKSDATSGIIEFCPFNQDLNRLTLVVKGAKDGKYNVTWGKVTKEFTSQQLTAGINLAAEFLNNPFSEPFQAGERAIRNQQNYETPLVKDLLNKLPTYRQMLPDQAESFEKIAAAAVHKDNELAESSSAAIKPVKHTLKIEAAK